VVPVDAPVLEALPTELPVELTAVVDKEVAPRDEVWEPLPEAVELMEEDGAAAMEKPLVEP